MQATVYNLAGEQVGNVDLDDAVFGITPNMGVVHRAVLRQQANARQGTHETKTRAFVRGGGRKPWRQKGTGRARQGSTRSPQWRHGGVVFGPHFRSYEQEMPRKMRRLAIRSVLSSKAADGHLIIIEGFEDLEPRTKAMIEVMNKLNIGKESALIFTAQDEDSLLKASNNLPNVDTMSAHLLSIVDMLKHTYVVMPRTALEVVHGILSNNGGRNKLPLRESTWAGEEHYIATAEPVARAEATSAPVSTVVTTEPAETKEAEGTESSDLRFAPSDVQQSAAASTVTEPEVAETPGSAEADHIVAGGPDIAAGTVTISNVQYSGEEYVELTNTGDAPADLSGWVLRDQNDEGQAFTFPEGTELAPGATLQVFTKPGNDYSFNSKRPIWNDKGDALELLDANGDVVSVYAYGSFAGGDNNQTEIKGEA